MKGGSAGSKRGFRGVSYYQFVLSSIAIVFSMYMPSSKVIRVLDQGIMLIFEETWRKVLNFQKEMKNREIWRRDMFPRKSYVSSINMGGRRHPNCESRRYGDGQAAL